jgi:hypothetical protein
MESSVKGSIPYLPIVVAVTAFVLFGFAATSGFVLVYTDDDVTKGNIIGTWQNFALLAVGFWLGSSSGGKAQPAEPVEPIAPQEVTVVSSADSPVHTEEGRR